MSDMPPLSETPTWPCAPCADCGWGVDDEILADTPDCPHGWQSLEDMALADIKALFASGAPDLSLDPWSPSTEDTTNEGAE